jgi:hypothetical protein
MQYKTEGHSGIARILDSVESLTEKLPLLQVVRACHTTEDMELAKEWAVEEDKSGFANKYELDLSNLKVLNLSNADSLSDMIKGGIKK